jgi:hypothetical protein
MDAVDYKVKMIYRHRIMAILCPVGAFLSTSHNTICNYYYFMQEHRPSPIRNGISIPCFVITLILIFTLTILIRQNLEFVLETFVLIAGAVTSLVLATMEDSHVTRLIRDVALRDKYYISLFISVLISYIFLLLYWIGMRKFLREPLQIKSILVKTIICISFFLPTLLFFLSQSIFIAAMICIVVLLFMLYLDAKARLKSQLS